MLNQHTGARAFLGHTLNLEGQEGFREDITKLLDCSLFGLSCIAHKYISIQDQEAAKEECRVKLGNAFKGLTPNLNRSSLVTQLESHLVKKYVGTNYWGRLNQEAEPKGREMRYCSSAFQELGDIVTEAIEATKEQQLGQQQQPQQQRQQGGQSSSSTLSWLMTLVLLGAAGTLIYKYMSSTSSDVGLLSKARKYAVDSGYLPKTVTDYLSNMEPSSIEPVQSHSEHMSSTSSDVGLLSKARNYAVDSGYLPKTLTDYLSSMEPVQSRGK